MIEFYPQIKWVHIAAVVFSGSVFLLRGLLVLAGRQSLALAMPVRILSYSIDTVLLTAALMLLSILPGALFANGWLYTKLMLLVLYVGLGMLALKRGRSAGVRLVCYLAALCTYLTMAGIALAHHPLGWLIWLR
ncbi:MAG: SirB2 family protein [Lysobacterales bacterium]